MLKYHLTTGGMTHERFSKNLPMSEAVSLAGLVTVEPGKIVSRTLVQRPEVTITLFSFAAGEGVSTHSAPGDAIVQVLEGEAKITIGGTPLIAKQAISSSCRPIFLTRSMQKKISKCCSPSSTINRIPTKLL